MKNEIVRCEVSAQQMEYLKGVAETLRSNVGDVLIAAAFLSLDTEHEDTDGYYLAGLRSFVDVRRLPTREMDRFSGYAFSEFGRDAEEKGGAR